jgi:hypothetical protein
MPRWRVNRKLSAAIRVEGQALTSHDETHTAYAKSDETMNDDHPASSESPKAVPPHNAPSADDRTSEAETSAATADDVDKSGFSLAAEADERVSRLPQTPASAHVLAEDSELTSYDLERRQLTISGLLIVITAVSVALAPVGFLPLSVYAGVLGALLLLLFVISAILGAREMIVRVTLWSLFVVYMITLLIACKDQLGL